jgi:hypothetical protein
MRKVSFNAGRVKIRATQGITTFFQLFIAKKNMSKIFERTRIGTNKNMNPPIQWSIVK